MLAIGIPVFLIFGGALLAFSFRPEDEQETLEYETEAITAEKLQPSTDELVSAIESHLREEQAAVEDFACNPDEESLLASLKNTNSDLVKSIFNNCYNEIPS